MDKMPSHGENPHKARYKQQGHHYKYHEEVEHRDDACSQLFSTTYSKRSDHDEENNKTLLNSFRHNETEEQKKAFKTSTILAKDVHYYAILARIHNAVTSVNNTPSLGSILEDANKRGMSLDAVIELYKEERIKAISLQGSSENNNAASKVSSTVMGVEGEKEVEQQHETWDVNECEATILSGIPEIKRCHDTYCPTESNKEVREGVEQKIVSKGTLHSNFPSAAPSFDSFSSSSTVKASITVKSGNNLALRYDDNSPHDNNIILKVSSDIENENWERRPDPPGHSSEYERHPDPPGLSLDDSRDNVSLSGSLTTQEHQDIFDNCVELVLKDRSKEAVTCHARSLDLEQNHSGIGRFEDDGIDDDTELYDKHPDPPGRSYSLTIDSDVMSSAAWSSTSTSHELDRKVSINEIDHFELKERNKYKEGYCNQSSQSHKEGKSSEVDSSEIRDFMGESKDDRQNLFKDDEENEKLVSEEMCPDTSRISTCSTSDSDNGVEIILTDCSIESEGAEPDENYFDDVASHQFFNASEPGVKQSYMAEESFVVDCAKLRNDVFHNIEGLQEAGEGELPQLESSSSSVHHVDDERFISPKTPQHKNTQNEYQYNYGDGIEFVLEGSLDRDEASSSSPDFAENDNERFSSPKTPQRRNTHKQNQDIYGDGVEFGLDDSRDDSIDDDDQSSRCSDEASSSSLDYVEARNECFSSPKNPEYNYTQQENQDTHGDGVKFGLDDSRDDSIDDDDETSHHSDEALSLSLDYVEAGNECFSLPKPPEHSNSQQENQDTYGDGVAFGLEDSHDDSIDDDDKTSLRSDGSLTQGANYDEEICTLGSEKELISGKGVKVTELAEGEKQELCLDMKQHLSYSTCNPDDMYTGSYFGSSVTHEHQDGFDNGIEIVLDESSNCEIEQLSFCDDAEITPSCNASTPIESVASIDISALDLDNMKLWKANSNDSEGSENANQNDQFDLLVQVSSSMTDSEHDCSHSCSISSTSEKFQDGSSHSNSDGIIYEPSEVSHVFSQVTEAASEDIVISESDETPAIQLNGSGSSIASYSTHKVKHELNCMSDASSSCSDNSKLEQCDGKEQVSMETGAFSEPSNYDSVGDNVNSRIGSTSAAVDAFFSRFSIQTDEDHIYVDCNDKRFQCKDLAEELGTDETCENDRNIIRRGELRSRDVRGTRNTIHNHRVRNGAEIANTMEHLPQSAKVDSYLPNHLGLWKSPWQKTKLNWGRYLDVAYCDTKISISSSEYTNRKNYLMGHSGYSNIDFYSLYEASLVQAEEEEIDQAPWECRDVGQRFLHEKSVESRNWFGSFELIRGNDRLQYPVCCPKSVEVSVTRIPEEGDWSEDWFTTWKSRKDNPNNLESFAQDDKENMVNDVCVETVVDTFREKDRTVGKNIVVEIGSLCPIRLRPGERITRIHPEYTSSLRQSRWRKKYPDSSRIFKFLVN